MMQFFYHPNPVGQRQHDAITISNNKIHKWAMFSNVTVPYITSDLRINIKNS